MIRRAPKRFSAAVLMVAFAIIIPATLFAWGPNRPTYTYDDANNRVCLASNTSTCVSPTQPTFNSITNTPNYGDERNFVTIKTTDGGSGSSSAWGDDITVQNNKEYFVRMYVHNNAEAEHVAEGVTAQFNIPDYSAKRIQIDGYLSSTNASPTKVWDQAVFNSDSNFQLQYVAGSAQYTNNNLQEQTRVFNLGDSVATTGAQLGYDSMNGKIPGCFEYAGYVTFKVKAVTSNFDIQKTVRVNSATDKTFKENVAVNAGDKVDYQLYFKNTGGTTLPNVSIQDTLPAGVTYVTGTTYLHNANGTRIVADGVAANGLNIGDYAPGADAYIKFTAEVNKNISLVCGPNTLRNIVKAVTSTGTKQNTADVLVNKVCAPGKITVCEIATKKIVTIDEAQFDTSKYTKDLTKCEVTPPELPKTGPTENIVAVIGLGALIASVVYYVRSRRLIQE